jgi:hypothetical protein
MPSENVYWPTLAEHLTHWSIGFNPKSGSQIVHDSNHDEQNGPPERRSQAALKLRIPRRRPVTFDVIVEAARASPTCPVPLRTWPWEGFCYTSSSHLWIVCYAFKVHPNDPLDPAA